MRFPLTAKMDCLGSIVRCMRRLEELLRQMCCAAKAIGNSELEAKFTEGREISNAIEIDCRLLCLIRYTKDQT